MSNNRTRTDADFAAMERKFAVEGAVKWIDELIANHERGVRDLREHRARLIEVAKEPTSMATPVAVLSWVVNAVQNIARNDRLDMAANHAAALALTEPKH